QPGRGAQGSSQRHRARAAGDRARDACEEMGRRAQPHRAHREGRQAQGNVDGKARRRSRRSRPQRRRAARIPGRARGHRQTAAEYPKRARDHRARGKPAQQDRGARAAGRGAWVARRGAADPSGSVGFFELKDSSFRGETMNAFRTHQPCVSSIAATSTDRPARRRGLLRASLVAAAVLVTNGFARAETVLVEAGKTMTWRANSSDPGIGTSWTAEGFNAGAWTAGNYGVGYETGTGAAALLATTVPAATNSVYTRTTFTIADVSAVTNLLVGADYDDGYAAWINGVEVFRSPQLPAGTLAWNTPAALHESSNAATPNYGTLADVSAKAIPALHNGTNVLAIGVWNSTLPSSDLVLVPKLTINAGASVSRGPYLQLGTASGIVVRWRTTVATDGCVRYGSAPGNLTQVACVPGTASEHVVPVSGLSANTAYFYSVGTTTAELAGNSSSYSFVTSPPAGTSRPTRVWALGDSGNANANASAVRDAYFNLTASTPTDLWLMLGDNAYVDGTDSEFQAAVFDTYPTMLRKSVLWPTLGNHDGHTADSASQSGPYYDIFTLPKAGEAGGLASGTEAYYSFDYGDIHFICLDSYETDRSMTGGMAQWLAADLADTTATWVIAFFHHPPYSKGSHDSDLDIEMIEMRENAVRLLEQGGVDLVLTGHSHSYERSFLIDGHYGSSATFTSSMKKDGGSGRED